MMQGWIDEVDDGIVYGRVLIEDEEFAFWVPLLNVMESQRVSLQPGSYVYIINGELVINNAMRTTHDIEMARVRGDLLFRHFGWNQANTPAVGKSET
jgi:hypothetical protein